MEKYYLLNGLQAYAQLAFLYCQGNGATHSRLSPIISIIYKDICSQSNLIWGITPQLDLLSACMLCQVGLFPLNFITEFSFKT